MRCNKDREQALRPFFVKNTILEDGSSALSLYRGDYTGCFPGCPIDTLYWGRDLALNSASIWSAIFGTSVKVVTIGSNVTTINEFSFVNCTALRTIYSHRSTPPTVLLSAFLGVTTSLVRVHVPSGNDIPAYLSANANTWNEFLYELTAPPIVYTLSRSGYTFTPPSITCDNVTGDSTGLDFAAQGATPIITINTQQVLVIYVTEGNISHSLTVAASVTQGATLSYQWYSNTTYDNTDGTAIAGATSANFVIPTTLTEGLYHYFCEVRATKGATPVRSNVMSVVVTAMNTGVANVFDANLKIFPNPVTNGQLIVENGQWQAGEAVEVYSMSGTLVATYKTTSEKTSVSVLHLPNGQYLLKVGGYTAKFVKQ